MLKVIKMEIARGVRIRRIFENRTSEGKPYWVMQVDGGRRISFFAEEAVTGLEPGDTVDIEYRRRGRYWNGLAVRKVQAEGEPAASEPAERAPGEGEEREAARSQPSQSSRDESIERQSAVRSAAILFQGRKVVEDEFQAMARRIYSFIKTGEFGEG
jgi:hypothetical protein